MYEQEGTLLLNASYEPLSIINWRKAICLFFSEKVDIIETSSQKIRSSSITLEKPSVVRLRNYVKKRPTRNVNFSRKNIYVRDSYTCQYCGKKEKEERLSFDHVIPSSKGGTTTWDNIVTCCIPCNTKKGSRTPEQANMTLLSVPHKPYFSIVSQVKSYPSVWKNYFFQEDF